MGVEDHRDEEEVMEVVEDGSWYGMMVWWVAVAGRVEMLEIAS